MTRRAASIGVLALLAMAFGPAAPRAADPPMTADQLVAQVIRARISTGFRLRVTLTRLTPGSKDTQIRQLLIKGRRDRERATVLYQVLWPTELASALVIRDPGDHQPAGFLYRSGRATPLTANMLNDSFIDSDLRLEDLAEEFWYWRSRKIVGEETVDEHRCTIVELRPARDTATAYSLIKAWIAPELGLPLRVEQFRRDGRLAKHIVLRRVAKQGKRWLPTLITIEPSDGRARTVLDGVKSEHDLQFPAAAFTVDAIRKSLQRPE